MTETKDEPWTILRLLNWTTDFFKKRGSESARLDAEILLAHARDCARIDLYTAFAEVPSDEQRVAFRELVRRRGEGTPVAQLVGYKEFYSLRFRVNEHVLIPRPETEELVSAAIDLAKQIPSGQRPLRIADVGTGSGVIAVTLAKQIDDCAITAVDVSAAAIKIAQWNADQHDVTLKITFAESDLLGSIDPSAQFHLILSNPPYITEAEYDQLDPSVRNFEPQGALVAGPDGCEVIRRLLAEAPNRLLPGGTILIELSPMIADACLEIAKTIPQLSGQRLIKDLSGHQRILTATCT